LNKILLLGKQKVDLGSGVSANISEILNNALNGGEVSLAEGEALFNAKSKDRFAIYKVADEFRRQVNGDHVSFVVNRNINFTNICYMGCKFCNFAKRTEDTNAEWLELEEIVERAQVAWNRGATEVCIQGGLHPKMSGNYYREILLAIKSKLPDMHIHAFSPFEIWYGSKKTKMSYRDFMSDLKECGLGSMPGTAAEILDTEVRQKLTKNKLSAEKWVEIIRTAHKVGIKTSATIMYGHVDGPRHWAGHIDLLRNIQKETGGFTELVPLSFVHTDSPLYINDPDTVRPGPTLDEVDLMHAVSRIMLHGWIDNIQVSWTKLGAERAQSILSRGVNDFGGTLMNESISRAAGSKNGQEITASEIVTMIRAAGRIPVRRNTLYEIKEIYKKHDPVAIEPLVERKGYDPLSFLEMFPEQAPNKGKL
jgi:FO synthase